MSDSTPGPWEASRAGDRINPSIFGSDGTPVCSCGGNALGFGAYSPETLKRRYANARLIASAPDMLAALRRMVALFAPQHTTDGTADGPTCQTAGGAAIEAARAVISKAEGRG